MGTPSVRCKHCGAPLHGAENMPLAACPSCGRSLGAERPKPPVFSTDNLRGKLEELDVVGRKNRLVEFYRMHGAGFGDARAARLTQTLGRTGGMVSTLVFTTAALGLMVGAFMVGAPWIIRLAIGFFVLVGLLTLVGFFRQPAAKAEQTSVEHKRPKSAKRQLKN